MDRTTKSKAVKGFDWSLIQAFLAVAETGSLSAAAIRLDASQPTLGRKIKQIEEQLGAELFVRKPRGFELTAAGTDLIGRAKEMEEAAQQLSILAAGKQSELAGTVRITASVWTAVMHLPKIIANIRKEEPDIEIELVPTDESSNLLFREADIAVRMYRPTQLDLITQHIGELELSAFAADSYISERGMPASLDDFLTHDLVGFDRDEAIIQGLRLAGIDADKHFFKTRCDDNIAYWNLVRAGCGIGFAQAKTGRAEPDVQEVELGFDLPTLPVWLTANEVMRQTPRIRRVWDMLAEGLKPIVM